jgi:NAD(P)H dehydrogenase (quinone)
MRIAVTGASGTVGRRVVDLLAADNEHDVVAVSRRPAPELAPRAVSVRADYADLTALTLAFAGADTLVFVSSDGVAVDVLHHHANIVRAARDAGVGHIVALSGLDADVTSPFCYAVTYGHTEQLLHASGCALSIVRTSIFTEFFVQAFLREARQRGEVRLPAEDSRVSLLSRTDVSRCLAALAVSSPTTRVRELTGPAALDMHDVAAQAAHSWRTPISYVDITPADFQRELAADDLDPWWCYAFSSMFASIRLHRWEKVTGEVFEITGHQPVTLGEVLGT